MIVTASILHDRSVQQEQGSRRVQPGIGAGVLAASLSRGGTSPSWYYA